jgi:flagellar motor switch protein FliM
MSLVELLKLSVGTVVEIPAFNEISLHVEGQPIFTGTIGERDGKMAVSLT